MSDQNMSTTGQGPGGVSPPDDPPPMTRRERREREAAALTQHTASIPTIAPTSPADSSISQAETPPVSTPAQPVTEIVEPAGQLIENPSPPMTRRERREMEERLRREQEGLENTPEVSVPAPQAAKVAIDKGVGVVENDLSPVDTPGVKTQPPASEDVWSPTSPTALPPVFEAPPGPPRSGFPIVVEDEDTHEAELASSREVGAGSPATHALILPTTPTMDLAGPIGDTGEILVTGQIPLPRLVTEQGVHGDLEEDARFDELIGAETTPLTSPVSAASAVSSKGSDREFHLVRRAPLGTAATVLGASAVLLVLAASGLLAVALFTDLLSWPF